MSDQINEVEQIKKEKFTVRTMSTGDKVYLIENGQRMWIRNPETLNKLGFTLGDEKTISYEELMTYKDGGSVNLQNETIVETKPEVEQLVTAEEDEKVAAIIGYRSKV